MAFEIRDMSVLAYASGFTLWLYRAEPDNFELSKTKHFFADQADLVAAGDMILISSPGGGCVVCAIATPHGIETTPLGV